MTIYQFKDKNNQKKITFFHIHIPKTGGTTLEHFFSSIGLRSFGAGHEYMFVRPYLKSPPNHYDMKILEQLYIFEGLYSFAITRDPIKRLYSQYQWARSNSNHIDTFIKMTFEQFVIDSFEKYSSDEYYMANYIKPQHHFISDKVTRIFKLEDGLENAIKTVFKDLQIILKFKNKDGDLKLPHINKSQPYNKDQEINDNVIKMIKDFYKEDYEKLGYDI
tara:strand:- start:4189 stop:4845 length:657 start_codon:yes stop_codon:yes gene_type:complete